MVTGSGKSVLLKLMLGLLKPDGGEIRIEGRNIVALPEKELLAFRKRMGMVFQEGALFDSMSVYENVAYQLREAGERDEGRIEQRVREVLRFVEMEQAIDKMPSELSGGMRRRASIARAIISQPSLVLYDSPTAGLDPITAHTINVLIAKLRDTQGVTSIVVTHRLQDTCTLAENVFSAKEQDLIPRAAKDGPRQPPAAPLNPTPGAIPVVRFLVLRACEVYFDGNEEEFVHARDPYVREFLV